MSSCCVDVLLAYLFDCALFDWRAASRSEYLGRMKRQLGLDLHDGAVIVTGRNVSCFLAGSSKRQPVSRDTYELS